MPHNPKTSFRDYDDGIVQGRVEEKRGTCVICETDQCVLTVTGVTMPSGMKYLKPDDDRIKLNAVRPVTHEEAMECNDPDEMTDMGYNKTIGITCGCLAKAHRQLARIDTARRIRRKW